MSQTMNQPKKILYGVCGIGNGHTFRQLPLIKHLAEDGHQIVIFAYNSSYDYFSKNLGDYPNVSIEKVAVPFYVGNKQGLDFAATSNADCNSQDFVRINARAMANAEKIMGTPDLVISDYEPICAQYAYAHDAPIITIDQQSKYFSGQFPKTLNEQSYQDEIMRLRMFFPKAAKRIACSFFNPSKTRAYPLENVEIVPPVLRDEIINLQAHEKTEQPSLLVYLTEQQPLNQPLEEIITACTSTNIATHIFLPQNIPLPEDTKNLHFHQHGDKNFTEILGSCHGIISTAGHSLLSEAMYLGIPVYALPLPLYEQQMNAQIIQDNHFGVSETTLTSEKLAQFTHNLSHYAANIAQDTQILLRTPGQDKIIAMIDRALNQVGRKRAGSGVEFGGKF